MSINMNKLVKILKLETAASDAFNKLSAAERTVYAMALPHAMNPSTKLKNATHTLVSDSGARFNGTSQKRYSNMQRHTFSGAYDKVKTKPLQNGLLKLGYKMTSDRPGTTEYKHPLEHFITIHNGLKGVNIYHVEPT